MQERFQGVLKEIKALQQQEHALQEESLSVRLRIEQIETTITEHKNKMKHWQKEVCLMRILRLARFYRLDLKCEPDRYLVVLVCSEGQ